MSYLNIGRSIVVLSLMVLTGALLAGCNDVSPTLGPGASQTTQSNSATPDGPTDTGGDAGSDADGGETPTEPETPVPDEGFRHPGVLSTDANFDRMRDKVANEEEPWLTGWQALIGDGYSQLGRNPRPLDELIRGGPDQNFAQIFGDIWASHASVIRWKITGETAYADQAVRFLNAWGSTLTKISGDTSAALTGLYAYQLANVADILRT